MKQRFRRKSFIGAYNIKQLFRLDFQSVTDSERRFLADVLSCHDAFQSSHGYSGSVDELVARNVVVFQEFSEINAALVFVFNAYSSFREILVKQIEVERRDFRQLEMPEGRLYSFEKVVIMLLCSIFQVGLLVVLPPLINEAVQRH